MKSILDLPGEVDREVAAWRATWCPSSPLHAAYMASGRISLRLWEADLVLAETMTPELGCRVVEWLATNEATAEPYFVIDAGRSYLLLRFSQVSKAVSFRLTFPCARPAASHLPEEF